VPKEDGVLVSVAGVFSESVGTDVAIARERALSLARLTRNTIEQRVPELVPLTSYLVTTMNRVSFALTEVDTRL
jgi:hypothetical protein